VLDCFGNVRLVSSSVDERRFSISAEGEVFGVLYPRSGFEFRSDISHELAKKESVGQNGNEMLKMEYYYDSWHRSVLSRIDVVGYRRLERTWSYDGDKANSVGQFNFIHFEDNSLYQISNAQPRVVYTKKYDYVTGKIVAQQLQISGEHIFNSETTCLPDGKVEFEEFEVLTQGNKTILKFEYDEDGIPVRSPTETMSYRSGMLDSIYSTNGIQVAIGRDHLNRLVRFGQIQLKWGPLGLIQIGAETMEWDHVAKPVKLNGQSLLYDQRGRLRQMGAREQLVYANQNFPFRVTHHFTNQYKLSEYFYDLNGALFAISRRDLAQESSELFFVVTLSNHSPRFVFSSTGAIIKEIQYSQFGRVIFDSNPDFELLIGHRGELCLRHVCFDGAKEQWRQTLTNEGVFFSEATAQLDGLYDAAFDQSDAGLQAMNKRVWPYHTDLKFAFINSRKDKILQNYFEKLNQPFLPTM